MGDYSIASCVVRRVLAGRHRQGANPKIGLEANTIMC